MLQKRKKLVCKLKKLVLTNFFNLHTNFFRSPDMKKLVLTSFFLFRTNFFISGYPNDDFLATKCQKPNKY